MNVLPFLGLSHILFGLILIGSKKKVKADYVLVFWLIILAVPFLSELPLGNSPLLRLNNPSLSLLNGPCLYLYLRELIKGEEDSPSYWPHLLIVLPYYLYFLFTPTASILPGGPQQLNNMTPPSLIIRHYGTFSLIVFAIYSFFSFRRLRLHKREVKETFAHEKGEVTLFWLSLIPLVFIAMVALIVMGETWLPLSPKIIHMNAYLFLALYLIYYGLKQKPVYQIPPKKAPPKEIEKVPREQELLEKLKISMDEEKLYLNPTLSIYDLSEATGISRHQISHLLNQSLSINFFQFVNGYRLEEVCLRLKEDKEHKENILEHALDSGFNSKSSFNSLFKEKYSQTPSQYRKSLA
ncbi:MAG: AraC family transcriptional regulator [Spirochaetales bacterium]|nr:AraC family transcriptional regulator [Spirochaetales bacterium]